MITITIDLLDALLSADHEKRTYGEAYLKSLTVEERCGSLLQFLTTQRRAGSSSTVGGSSSHLGDHHLLLSAVLLRRDILRLTNAYVLQEMVPPLLALFTDTTEWNHTNLRRQVGHCLTAICQTLTLLNHNSECDAIMNTVFNQIISLCTAALDIPSIRLAASLADWTPRSFQRIGAVQMIPPLMQTTMSFLGQNQPNDQLLHALIEMLAFAAIATNTDSQNLTTLPASSTLQPTNETASQLGQSGLMPLLPYVAKCCHNDGNAILPTLQILAHAATACPSFLAGINDNNDSHSLLSVTTEAFQSLAATEELEADVRLSCLQILSDLYATPLVHRRLQTGNRYETGILLSGPGCGVFYICVQLIVDGIDDDVQAWATEAVSVMDKEADLRWEQDRVADDSESVFESFLQTLGATRSFPVVLRIAEQLFASPGEDNWKRHVAAMSVLQCCLGIAPKSFTPYLSMTVDKALQLTTNSNNLRVQYRALWYLGVVCEVVQPQDESHSTRILQAVLQTVASSPCAKLVCMALDVCASFCQGSEKEDVASFLPHVLPTLLAAPWQVPSSNYQQVVSVQVRALRAVACWAAAAGEAVVPYYQQVMPWLLQSIQAQQHAANNSTYEMIQLLGAAVEAGSMMGNAIGLENFVLFRPDAQFLLQQVLLPMLLQTQQSSSDNNDDLEFVWTACARISSVMGKEFLPYVHIVLPHLLRCATAPPDVEIEEGDEAGLEATRRGEVEQAPEEGIESMTVTLPGRGLTKVIVNVSKIQAKALAARVVYELAISLESSFIPFAAPCFEAFLSLVDFPYASEVRCTAAQTLGAVFQATCSDDEQMVDIEVPKRFLPDLISAIAKQVGHENSADPDVLFNFADALSDILYATYGNVRSSASSSVAENFSSELAKAAVEPIMKTMASCLERRVQLIHQISREATGMSTGENDGENVSEQIRREEQLLTTLVDSVGYMLKLLRENFTPIFDSLVSPVLDAYLVSQNPDARGRHAAVCLWDDCIEHCGPVAVARHAPQLAVGVVLGVNDATNAQNEDLKQAALYGLCQLARFAPTAILEPRALLSQLLALCQNNMGSNDVVTNQYILENAVSAMASMTLLGKAPFASLASELISREVLLEVFLNNLPLREDEDEAKICHAGLCEMVQKGQIGLVHQAQHLLRIIGETLESVSNGDDVATPETCATMVQILRELQNNLPAEQMKQAFDELPAEAQAAIQEAMHQYAQQHSNVVTP